MSKEHHRQGNANDSQKQQLTEHSEESEYETISQDEGLASPLVVVAPYTIDDDFSLSSTRPLKRTRVHQEPTVCAPSPQEHSQEQEEDSSNRQPEATAGPSSDAATNTSSSTTSSTPSIRQQSANQQDGQDSTPKFASLSQASLPNNQQANMSSHARANSSQQAEATDQSQQQQPIASPRDNRANQQQQRLQEACHRHQVNIRVFILRRRAPNHSAFAVFMYYLSKVLQICFFASILYMMYSKNIIPLPPSSSGGRDKLYVLKRM